VKFIFADSLDYVDPGYDFLRDEFSSERSAYWDDLFPHELLETPPYDGILVSRAIVGDHKHKGKYTESQAMRFRREGARKFLRLEDPRFRSLSLFGDNGAFSYAKSAEPPYSVDETLEFYTEGRFTHGCSVDHVIFEFDPRFQDMTGGSPDARYRFEITQTLARQFLRASNHMPKLFTPIGVVQGWSPGSYAMAAENLVKMGYQYIAIGGLVPLKTHQIHMVLSAIRERVPKGTEVEIHLLGFAKADHISDFRQYGVTSFDSTSPLVRAFKDKSKNYYLPTNGHDLEYFAAIRIPQALENPRLKRHIRQGTYRQEDLLRWEKSALNAVRGIATGDANLDEALESLRRYSLPLIDTGAAPQSTLDKQVAQLIDTYRRTLAEKPWEKCSCEVCRTAGIEVIIFRASNRNKRRGIHNLRVFHRHVRQLQETP